MNSTDEQQVVSSTALWTRPRRYEPLQRRIHASCLLWIWQLNVSGFSPSIITLKLLHIRLRLSPDPRTRLRLVRRRGLKLPLKAQTLLLGATPVL